MDLLGDTNHLPRRPILLAKLNRIRPAGDGKLSKLPMGEMGLKTNVRQYVKSSNLLHGFSSLQKPFPSWKDWLKTA
jgi:hypothetical protein